MDYRDMSRSWFCVLNNPQKLFGDIDPSQMVYKAIDLWTAEKPLRTCAVNFEIGASGTPHMHMVLEDPSKIRFSAVQKIFPGLHVEPTRGTKAEAEDYINKRGKFEEKEHTVVIPAVFHGEIKANKGKRNDLYLIQEFIEKGYTPNQIYDESIYFRQHEKIVKQAFFSYRLKNAGLCRDVKVIWHVGDSGTGKSHSYIELCNELGRDNVYLFSDYENGGFDNYCAEPVLFIDEFKGEIKFSTFLTYLDKYLIQVHCRYNNVYALWNEVHITSVYPPEEVYRFMVEEKVRNRDKIKQLLRRIDTYIYHYIEDGEYKSFSLSGSQYRDYAQLKYLALDDKFTDIPPELEKDMPWSSNDGEQLNIKFDKE